MNKYYIAKKALDRIKPSAVRSYSRAALDTYLAKRQVLEYNQLKLDNTVLSSTDYNIWINNNWYRIELQKSVLKELSVKLDNVVQRLANDSSRLLAEIKDINGYTYSINQARAKSLKDLYISTHSTRNLYHPVSNEAIIDPKTKLVLDNRYILNSEGLVNTLPINNTYLFEPLNINFSTLNVITGNTVNQYEISSLSDFRNNKSLNIKIYKDLDFNDPTTNLVPPYFALEYEFSNQVIINAFDLKFNSKELGIISIEYYADGWQTFDFDDLFVDNTGMLFKVFLKQTLIASKVRLVFACSSNQYVQIYDADRFDHKLNKVLKDYGFNGIDSTVYVGGYFNIIIDSITFKYNVYQPVGYMASVPFIVNGARGFYYQGDYIGIRSASSDNLFLNDIDRFEAETYLNIDILDNDVKTFSTVIPILSKRRMMRRRYEILVLQNNVSKFSFFPIVDNQIKIYNSRDGLLAIGTDYLLSFDGGTSWQSDYTYPTGLKFLAGNCLVKILMPKSGTKYAVYYKISPNQYLDFSMKFKLVGYSVVIPQEYRASRMQLQFMEILRSPTKNSSVSPGLVPSIFGVR